MPSYLVKEYGTYAIFSTVVMGNVTNNYPSLDQLLAHEERARGHAEHMSEADLAWLESHTDVGENDYWWDEKTQRMRLAPEGSAVNRFASVGAGTMPPLDQTTLTELPVSGGPLPPSQGIQRIDNDAALSIIKELRSRLDPMVSSMGLTVQLGKGTYDPNFGKLSLSLTFALAGRDPEKARFEQYAAMYGLQTTDYGRTFTMRGSTYRLTGIDPAKPKFPILGSRIPTGTKYKFPADAVRAALAR